MSRPVQQELQILTVGALNIIKLMNIKFAQILGNFKRKVWKFEEFKKFERRKKAKFSLVLNPLTSHCLDVTTQPKEPVSFLAIYAANCHHRH